MTTGESNGWQLSFMKMMIYVAHPLVECSLCLGLPQEAR